jgi:hypothetical protein
MGIVQPNPTPMNQKMGLVRQSLINLDRDNPNNVMVFNPMDFEYLKRTK